MKDELPQVKEVTPLLHEEVRPDEYLLRRAWCGPQESLIWPALFLLAFTSFFTIPLGLAMSALHWSVGTLAWLVIAAADITLVYAALAHRSNVTTYRVHHGRAELLRRDKRWFFRREQRIPLSRIAGFSLTLRDPDSHPTDFLLHYVDSAGTPARLDDLGQDRKAALYLVKALNRQAGLRDPALVAGAYTEKAAPLPPAKIPQPQHIQLRSHGGRPVLRRGWRGNFLGALAGLIFTVLLAVLAIGAFLLIPHFFLQDMPWPALAGCLVILLALWNIYYCSVRWFNFTDIRIDQAQGADTLFIRHRPFPWPGEVQLPHRDITRYYMVDSSTKDSYGRITRAYEVRAQLRNSKEVILLRFLPKVEEALYIQQALQTHFLP
jgi:membrane protein YdbS with pleckstrin-like domain